MIKSYLKIFAGDVLGSLNSAIVALPQALALVSQQGLEQVQAYGGR